MAISTDDLLNKASQRTGFSDFGAHHYRPILEAFVDDLNHQRLSDAGRHVLSSLMVTDLSRRLNVIEALKSNPEIDDVTLPPILYISGHERSGTTFLHNLLTLVPGNRALQRWELMHPLPPPEAATYTSDPRIAKTQASIDKLRGTQLENLHWVEADEPDECAWALINGSSILGGAASFSMPTWTEATNQSDNRSGLKEYRQILKLLLWRNPISEGGSLVLKCPQFSGRLPIVSKVLPEAKFVLTHRDPFRAVTSVTALAAHINTPFVDKPNFHQDGGPHINFCISRMEDNLAALVDFAETSPVVSNVRYSDLVSSPAQTVASVYEGFGLDLPTDTLKVLETFVDAQKAGRRAKPPNSLPTFGLDQESFLARPGIAQYCSSFGLTPETKRQTGA